jgi:hypothetical protein
LLDSQAVLHEWHDPVNNPGRQLRHPGQAADFSSDSNQVDTSFPALNTTKDRCRLKFVPF